MQQASFSFRDMVLVAAWCMLPFLGMAQGWQRFSGGPGNQRAFAVGITVGGGLLAAGSTQDTVNGQTDWYMVRTDSAGNITTQSHWGTPDSSEYAVSILQSDENQAFVLGNMTYPFAGPSGLTERGGVLWQKVDYQGNVLSEGGDNTYISLAASSTPFENGYLVVGSDYHPIVDAYFPQPYWFLLDSAGSIVWAKTFPVASYGEAQSAVSTANHTAVVAGYELSSGSHQDILLYQINASGNINFEKHLKLPDDERGTLLTKSGAGALVLVGEAGSTFNNLDILLAKIDPSTLDTMWYRRLSLPGSQQPHAAVVLANGNVAIAGEYIPEGLTSRDAFLAVTDSSGNLLWIRTYGGAKGDIFWDIQPSADGDGFILAGQTGSFSQGGDLQAWLVRTDSLGRVWSNLVAGHVVRDATQNCVADAGETPLTNWFVTASGPGVSLYTLTDSLGAYSMEVDTGVWYISTLPPSGYWLACEDSVQLMYPVQGDTMTVDFPTQVLYECPLLDVDITTPFLRRCFENTYYVRYFNYGTSAATNASVSVILDPYLSVTGSSIPYTQAGDTLFFAIGAVPWLSGGDFSFTTYLDCDSTVLGQQHCTEAHIIPDSLCYHFSPDWDGSHLEVDGYCAGDSVVLTVTNTGLDMQGAVNFIITEDQIIFRQSTLQLGENQDTTFVLHPNGATVTIVVTQAPGHPGNSQPMLVLEGCGQGVFSTGYAFQFPQNDGDPSTDIECRPNIGSFDPNDKTGLPLGITDQGIIAPGTKIEYLIRFQNTGTDTAFRVEIRDTLSKSLDPATFRRGAASHPYRLNISAEGVLQFLFDPIALPDSSHNMEASQGFVKFSIQPKINIPPGTAVKNRAAIYFDQNQAVQTNTTLHTVDNPIAYLQTKSIEPNNAITTSGILFINPNPTNAQILVNLRQPSGRGGLLVEISDALGMKPLQKVYWTDPVANPLNLNLSVLPAGLYFIIATDEHGNCIARERVVKI